MEAKRFVVEPIEIAFADHNHDASDTDIRFGGAHASTSLIILRFAPTWGSASVQSAFLILDPILDTPPSSEEITLEVSRIKEPWPARAAQRWSLPTLSVTTVHALVSFAPPASLRIDITPLVREWTRIQTTDYILALRASTSQGLGVRYAFGANQGPGPRLDVYAWLGPGPAGCCAPYHVGRPHSPRTSLCAYGDGAWLTKSAAPSTPAESPN